MGENGGFSHILIFADITGGSVSTDCPDSRVHSGAGLFCIIFIEELFSIW